MIVSLLALAAILDLVLPTQNRALLEGRPGDFFQFVDRDFQGQQSTPWEGGQFGFVRGPRATAHGVVFQHFHEGIDIKPLQRNATGYPLDTVCAIAEGTVVYINATPKFSNYGNYVVVRHRWVECDCYSLYAHLNRIEAPLGAQLAKGDPLGQLGFTGDGIDQRRAHLHLEINLLLSPDFNHWHHLYFPTETNHHGLFNGLNLAGIDPARLFVALQKNPNLSMPEFVSAEEPAFEVLVPGPKPPPLLHNYPWLGASAKNALSWAILFNSSGLPLKITADNTRVADPQLRWIKVFQEPCSIATRGLVSGRGNQYHLSESGIRYMRLLIGG